MLDCCFYDNNLYPFQKTMVRWMKHREKTPIHMQSSNGDKIVIDARIAFMCNPPGTGKTRICTALLTHDKYGSVLYDHMLDRSVIGDGLLTICAYHTYPCMNSSLVIVSESKMEIWKKELSLFSISFHIITKKSHLRSIDWSNNNVSVFLVVPSMYNLLIDEKISDRIWERVIYEYPLFNSIYNMKKPISKFIWMIMNNPKQLFHHRFPKHHFLRDFVQSLDRQYIQWISLCNLYHSIQGFIAAKEPFHIYLHLYPSLHILLDILKNHHHELYFEKLCVFDKTINPYPDILLNKKCKNMDKSTCFSLCFICMNVSHKIWIQMPCCFHILCSDCTEKWLEMKYQCPNCRTNVTTLDDFLFFKNDHMDWMEAYRLRQSDIHDKIIHLLSKRRHDRITKVVLFGIQPVIPELQSVFNSIFYLTKDVRQNQQKIESFRKNMVESLLYVQDEFMIYGHEIPECTDMIFMRNTEHKSYLIGRVQRIGRDVMSPALHVYHFL